MFDREAFQEVDYRKMFGPGAQSFELHLNGPVSALF